MASHANSTRTPLLRHTTGSTGLLPASLPGGRIVAVVGPVTRALGIMAAADPDLACIRVLRRSIADRIEADIALLDTLGGDADFEADHAVFRRQPGGDYAFVGTAADDEPSLCGCTGHTFGEMLEPGEGGDDREGDAGDEPEQENEHGSDDDRGEPSLCGLTVAEPSIGGDDREHDEAERGIADFGAMLEAQGHYA